MNAMLIEVTRTGGLANLRRRVQVDTEELPAEQRDHVTSLVEGLDLDDLEQRSPLRGPGADRFEYDITITQGGREQHVFIEESRLSDDLQELLNLLFEGQRS